MVGLAATVPAACAREGAAAEKSEERSGEAEHGNLEVWKWANFVVLAGIIGYFAGKNAGPFFASRSRQIRKDMMEASDARQDAERRATEVDRRLANLEADIAALRTESQSEGEAETARLSKHTAAEMAKIQAQAEQEIDAAGKAARMELKRYSARLAIELAEEKIRNRMTPETQEALARGFLRDLEHPSSKT
jgi:F-type H+-transporting ATPase subunit b